MLLPFIIAVGLEALDLVLCPYVFVPNKRGKKKKKKKTMWLGKGCRPAMAEHTASPEACEEAVLDLL